METLELLSVVPDPVSLMESMRAVGYSPESAIADLIDNSISASATVIEVEYDASEAPCVAILDDGVGMTAAELTEAMRHGSQNPTEKRDLHDLGRFGLGLKTASLSQCRKFTVISKKAGGINARCWDLDVVLQEEKWVVVVPPLDRLKKLPLFEKLVGLESGTLVAWQDLDRLTAGAKNPQAEMTHRLSPLEGHLALVFHRFTRKEGGFAPIEIRLNGRSLLGKDPFLTTNTFCQPLEGQTIVHERGKVVVSPFVLPPISKLSPDEVELAGGKDGLRGTQGFYIYRNRRLVIWGTWFRLVPKEEFYKLTRVQVDIPNSFDDLWALDIKKSAAFPPDIIRNRLKELIPHFAGQAKRTITYPGRRFRKASHVSFWIRNEPTHGHFRYELNMEHPLVLAITNRLDAEGCRNLQLILNLASETLPLESIYADMCSDHRKGGSDIDLEELIERARALTSILGLTPEAVLDFDPIAAHPDQHDAIRKALRSHD